MNLQLVALNYKDDLCKNIDTFKILDTDTGQVTMQTYNNVYNVLKNNTAKIHGIEIDSTSGMLKGSNGSFNRYPHAVNGTIKYTALVVIYLIDDIGVGLYTLENTIVELELTQENLGKLSNNIANAKVSSRGDKLYISPIKGIIPVISYDKSQIYRNKKLKEKATEYIDITKKEIDKKYTVNSGLIPRVITGARASNSKLKEMDSDGKYTIEQKLVYAMLAVKEIRPFYYTILSILKRVEASPEDNIDTMAVSSDTLFFSSDFIKSITVPEIIFVLLHEICHIAMKHMVRGDGKNHSLWNIATDLYINKALADEFCIDEKGDVVQANRIAYEKTDLTKYYITVPTNVLFSNGLDINTDTPEKIYDELFKIPELRNGLSSNNGNNSKEGGSGDSNGSNSNKNNIDVNIEINGKNITIKGELPDDMVNTKDDTGKSKEQIAQEIDTLIRRAISIQEQKFGSIGNVPGLLERIAKEIIAPKVNWRHLVRRFLTIESEKENSFSHPDRRFLSRSNSDGSRQIFPGPYAAVNGRLGAIKICVDTSGSISDKDLAVALNQTKDLLNQYKASAELIYWDTDVAAVYELDDVNELLKKKPMGGGGTDVNCVFKHFDTNKDYRTYKKEKPSLILIFTDGYFGSIESEYYRKYGNKVIWIIANNKSFKEPFGVKADFIDN